MNSGLTPEPETKAWPSRAGELRRARADTACRMQQASAGREAAAGARLWAWFWKQCLPPHTGCVARRVP